MLKYNLIDYVNLRGDLSFEKDHFNALDALVLNMVAFIDYQKIAPLYKNQKKIFLKTLLNKYFKIEYDASHSLGLMIPNDIYEITKRVYHSPRYSKIKISNYINKVEQHVAKQFSALVFHIDRKNILVSFRGTDDSLAGWAEDLNMLAYYPIPSQQEAKDYLEQIASLYPNFKIYLCGHSKGGNLAIYSSLNVDEEIRNRIKKVYSFDGPGFLKENLDCSSFNDMKDKIIQILPSSSVIGRIFSLDVNHQIVESQAKGLDQHDPFSWEINYNHFVETNEFTKNSNKIKEEVEKLIEKLSLEERKDLVDDLNKYIESLKQNHLIEFVNYLNLFSLISNKYKMKRKNIRYLLRLYLILYRNKAIVIKLKK